MRVSSVPPSTGMPVLPPEQPISAAPAQQEAPGGLPPFSPFDTAAFEAAYRRSVPVFLVIGELTEAFADPAVAAHLAERTVPVRLLPGERPDVELLCQRAGVLFSQEGALPLCALLLSDGRPFLAAPLPPPGFALDPARLFVWLTQADRRFSQNLPALTGQAAQVIRSLHAQPLRKPYTPADAAHDLSRALLAVEDKASGGFGQTKTPFVCGLRFLQHEAVRGSHAAHGALSRSLDAMLTSALYDPLDGLFFRATLTDDWRVFVPEKPLGVNAMLALILLESGRRSEALLTLGSVISLFPATGGAFSPFLHAERETYAFSPQQVCAALGSEDGLRACRLLGLLRQHTPPEPGVTPSRFSPVPETGRRPSPQEEAPLCPTLSPSLTPEDAAFLRRVSPALLRVRAVRARQTPAPWLLVADAALAAAVLAQCGQKLGEPRYLLAAQRAVTQLSGLPTARGALTGLPASISPVSPLLAQATCAASAALALAMLSLGREEGMGDYAAGGLRLLSAALHAFVRPDGLVMHTPEDAAAWFPRVPALCDSELPSPAALLVHALRIAQALRPQGRFDEAIETIWQAAAPHVRERPLECAALIDAVSL